MKVSSMMTQGKMESNAYGGKAMLKICKRGKVLHKKSLDSLICYL
jgi:hypothetical protein